MTDWTMSNIKLFDRALTTDEIRDEFQCDLAAQVPIEIVEPTGWQPIETAPNNKEILICGEEIYASHLIVTTGWWDNKTKCWEYLDVDENGYDVHELRSVRWWMPLPALPKVAK